MKRKSVFLFPGHRPAQCAVGIAAGIVIQPGITLDNNGQLLHPVIILGELFRELVHLFFQPLLPAVQLAIPAAG